MSSAILQAKFDDILEEFNNSIRDNDSVGIENVNYAMHKDWLSFIDAGFDVNQVISMMSGKDISDHYDTLLSYGAEIDITKYFWDFDRVFVVKHLNDFINRGVSLEDIVSKCGLYSSGTVESDIERIVEFSEKGIDIRVIFTLFQKIIDDALENQDSDYIIGVFMALCQNGLPKEELKKWLDQKTSQNGFILCDIVEENPDEWEKLGVNISDYADKWLRYYYDHYYYHRKPLKDLPKSITEKKFIEFFSMEEILNLINEAAGFSFYDFLTKEISSNENLEILAHKFVDEIGYSADHMGEIIDFIMAGSSVIDLKEIEKMDFGDEPHPDYDYDLYQDRKSTRLEL